MFEACDSLGFHVTPTIAWKDPICIISSHFSYLYFDFFTLSFHLNKETINDTIWTSFASYIMQIKQKPKKVTGLAKYMKTKQKVDKVTGLAICSKVEENGA